MTTRRTARRALGTVAAVAAAGLVVAAPSGAAGADDPKSPQAKAPRATPQLEEVKEVPASDKLGQHDQELLAEAEAQGTKRVTVIMATEKKQTEGVVDSLEAVGGFAATVNDKVGYVRASLPTGSVERVAGLRKVVAVDLDETIPRIEPDPASGNGAAARAAAGPGKDTPDANPYMPTRDTGSTGFKAKHPTWDGRDITIGILDSGVDLDNPALQTTSTGERKIVDWVTGTDPVFDGDGTWRVMLNTVQAEPGFEYAGEKWRAPRKGTFAINRFSESITAGSEPDGDVNRDGDTTDKFGVLYDYATNDTWVDADQNRRFTDAERMRPYKEDYDVGHFGTDDPATEVVESMPFTVEFRKDVDLSPYGGPYVGQKADFVNIGIVEDAHGSHVAGITAAHQMFGGSMDGQAPGAKLVSSRGCTWGGGCTAAALMDGMVDLVATRGVDVVNMSIGGLPALNDANNARAELYDRLISDYGVQLFISAGNSGPGVNTVGDPSVATDVVSVASSISKQTWQANYGSSVSSKQNLHNFSSRGPREDGGFKPNISAPGSAISTVPLWLKQPDLPQAGYTLPIGYAMFNGTSMASPQAAGAAAVLLSATLDRKIPVTPRQLRDAMYTSAGPIKDVPVVGQGTGLANVPRAFRLLKKRATTQDYTVVAPVCTTISDLLATPNKGPGVYNRCDSATGGQKVGKAKTYKVKVTRTSGPSKAVRHTVRVVGGDGTFSAPRSVSLNNGRTSTLSVRARATTPGLHSAIMEIDDPSTPVVDHRVMLAVVASTNLTKPAYATSERTSVERNLTKSYSVTVPKGTKALQVNLTGIATQSQVRFTAFNPYGVPVDSTASSQCFTNYSDIKACKPTSRAYADPLPGVWEITVEARRTTPFLDNPLTLKAAIQGVVVDPAQQRLDSVTVGEPAEVTWSLKNQYGPVKVTPKGGPLGSAVSERPSIEDGQTQNYEVVVPAGATSLTATIGNPSDVASDLDLTVFDGAGRQVAQSADGDSEESVTIASPAPGTYRVEVDGYSVPSGSTEYDYLDVFYSPALGSLNVPGTAIDLPLGGTTSVTGTITARQGTTGGRQLFGEMQVRSSEGALLGTGSVTIGSVVP